MRSVSLGIAGVLGEDRAIEFHGCDVLRDVCNERL